MAEEKNNTKKSPSILPTAEHEVPGFAQQAPAGHKLDTVYEEGPKAPFPGALGSDIEGIFEGFSVSTGNMEISLDEAADGLLVAVQQNKLWAKKTIAEIKNRAKDPANDTTRQKELENAEKGLRKNNLLEEMLFQLDGLQKFISATKAQQQSENNFFKNQQEKEVLLENLALGVWFYKNQCKKALEASPLQENLIAQSNHRYNRYTKLKPAPFFSDYDPGPNVLDRILSNLKRKEEQSHPITEDVSREGETNEVAGTNETQPLPTPEEGKNTREVAKNIWSRPYSGGSKNIWFKLYKRVSINSRKRKEAQPLPTPEEDKNTQEVPENIWAKSQEEEVVDNIWAQSSSSQETITSENESSASVSQGSSEDSSVTLTSGSSNSSGSENPSNAEERPKQNPLDYYGFLNVKGHPDPAEPSTGEKAMVNSFYQYLYDKEKSEVKLDQSSSNDEDLQDPDPSISTGHQAFSEVSRGTLISSGSSGFLSSGSESKQRKQRKQRKQSKQSSHGSFQEVAAEEHLLITQLKGQLEKAKNEVLSFKQSKNTFQFRLFGKKQKRLLDKLEFAVDFYEYELKTFDKVVPKEKNLNELLKTRHSEFSAIYNNAKKNSKNLNNAQKLRNIFYRRERNQIRTHKNNIRNAKKLVNFYKEQLAALNVSVGDSTAPRVANGFPRGNAMGAELLNSFSERPDQLAGVPAVNQREFSSSDGSITTTSQNSRPVRR